MYTEKFPILRLKACVPHNGKLLPPLVLFTHKVSWILSIVAVYLGTQHFALSRIIIYNAHVLALIISSLLAYRTSELLYAHDMCVAL